MLSPLLGVMELYSVMTGCHHVGVAALLKCMNNPVHCICHMLALASGHASNDVKYLTSTRLLYGNTFTTPQ